MLLILDTTVLIDALLNPAKSKYLDLLRKSDMYAPDIIVAELGNVLWKYVRFKNMDIGLAEDKFQLGLDLISQIIPADMILKLSFNLAIRHQISFYDSLYLAIAIELKSPLLTLDKKLNEIAKEYKLNYSS